MINKNIFSREGCEPNTNCGETISAQKASKILGVSPTTLDIVAMECIFEGSTFSYGPFEIKSEIPVSTILEISQNWNDVGNKILEAYREKIGPTIDEIYAKDADEYSFVRSLANVFKYVWKRSNYGNMWRVYNRMSDFNINSEMMTAYLFLCELNDIHATGIDHRLWTCIIDSDKLSDFEQFK